MLDVGGGVWRCWTLGGWEGRFVERGGGEEVVGKGVEIHDYLAGGGAGRRDGPFHGWGGCLVGYLVIFSESGQAMRYKE